MKNLLYLPLAILLLTLTGCGTKGDWITVSSNGISLRKADIQVPHGSYSYHTMEKLEDGKIVVTIYFEKGGESNE